MLEKIVFLYYSPEMRAKVRNSEIFLSFSGRGSFGGARGGFGGGYRGCDHLGLSTLFVGACFEFQHSSAFVCKQLL